MKVLDNTSAIDAGGWDPRHAVTLALSIVGDVAAALIDTNGDGGDIDLDEYTRDPVGHWQARSSSGGAGDAGTSWSPDLVAVYGRTDPGREVLVDYGGETYPVAASSAGWWLFVAPTAHPTALPGVSQ